MDTSKDNTRATSSVRVRLAKPADAEKITTVINSAFRLVEEFFVDEDRIDTGSVLNFLNSGQFLLAEREGTLLGSVYVESSPFPDNQGSHTINNLLTDNRGNEERDLGHGPFNSQSEIHNPQFPRAYLGLLAVDPAYQQSGLGSVLMNAAEDYCRAQGASFMDIKVVSLREELCGFYRRRGYVKTGTSSFPAEVETKLPCHFIDMSKPLRAIDKENE